MKRRIRGLSLVELMISMVIGLVVVGAVVVSYVGSGQAGRYQSALTQMNQDAQAALSLLSREIQLAGYSAPSVMNSTGGGSTTLTYTANFNLATTTFIYGCGGAGGSSTFVDPTASTLACNSVSTENFSGFGVTYEADNINTVPLSGSPTDCLGNVVPLMTPAGLPSYYRAQNRYYINTNTTSGRPELYCASDSAGAVPQAVFENVEGMKVWYGISAGGGSRQVIRYVQAGTNMIAGTINAQPTPATDWSNVISVRICLVVRSAEPALLGATEDSKSYQDCDGNLVSPTDNYLRRAYFTTSTLRTKMAF